MQNIECFIAENKNLLETALSIRKEVFVVGQKIDANLEYDVYDNTANHYLLFIEGIPVATARWRETEKEIKLERFAVLNQYRNKGLGKILLERVLQDVIKPNKPIYLHAQKTAANLYLRNGFTIKKEPFFEAGIEHYHMEYHQKI